MTTKNVAPCAIALALLLAGGARAQNAEPADATQAGNQTLDEVTVTGSRIRRTTDFDTANPTTVIDATYLKDLGIVNVGDVVKQLPSNVSNNTPATTGNANFFAGSTIANLRGLNPFFGSRTLTLLNSRRFVPTNQGDSVDLNFIPSVLIDRIDVVTGGASAAYGSGAVSGVQNIFLDRKLSGGKFEADFGQTTEGDGKGKHVGAAFGTGFMQERAHATVGFEWEDTDPIGCYNARDWCAVGNGFYSNPIVNPMSPPAQQIRANGQSTAGAPAWALGQNVRKNQMSTSGTFYTAIPVGATAPFVNPPFPATTLQANAAGTALIPFNIGQQPFGSLSATNDVIGGDGRSIYQYTNLRAPVDRKVATGSLTFALSDSMNLNVDLSWGDVETVDINGALDAQNQTVRTDNAYVVQNPGLQAAFGPGVTSRLLNKDWTAQVDAFSRFTTEVKRGAIGLDGKFGGSSWGWDAYFQYGETDREQLVHDNRHLNAYLMAVDSVIDNRAGSGTFGQPVCRVTRDGFAAAVLVSPQYNQADPRIAQGCVPLSPFGTGAIPQAARDYAFGFLRENLNYKQQVLAANFSGDVFKGFGAGPIQAAVGVEYRVEKGENIAAEEFPEYIRTDYLIQYGESFAGDVDVTEGYLETNFPLLQGVTGAQKLELNLAARESHYKNQGKFGTTGETRSHNLFTWKAQAIWDPVDWLRVRSTQSRDARAANFRELYYGQTIHAGGTFGYCGPTGTVFQDPCDFSLLGNVDLRPEKADTTTVGIVFTPKELLPNFQFAADYFRINITEAIQQANSRRVLDACQILNNPEFCALLVPDTPGSFAFNQSTNSGIRSVRALAFNGSGYTFKGIDFTTNYLWQVNDANSINFRLLATKMIDQLFQATPGAPFLNLVGQTGTANSFLSDNQPTAEWRADLAATWNRGPLSLTGQVRYISDGKFNYRGVSPGDAGFPNSPPIGGTSLSENHVPSYAVSTLSGSYMFEDFLGATSLQVFATVSNLFDRDPPIAPGNMANANGGTNAVFFDTQGRSYRFGIRMTF